MALLSQEKKKNKYSVSTHYKRDKKELTPSGICVLNKLTNNTLTGFVKQNVCKVQKNI